MAGGIDAVGQFSEVSYDETLLAFKTGDKRFRTTVAYADAGEDVILPWRKARKPASSFTRTVTVGSGFVPDLLTRQCQGNASTALAGSRGTAAAMRVIPLVRTCTPP